MYRVEGVDERGFVKQRWRDQRKLESRFEVHNTYRSEGEGEGSGFDSRTQSESRISKFWERFKKMGSEIVQNFKRHHPELIITSSQEQDKQPEESNPNPVENRVSNKYDIEGVSDNSSENKLLDSLKQKETRQQDTVYRIPRDKPEPLDIKMVKRNYIPQSAFIHLPLKKWEGPNSASQNSEIVNPRSSQKEASSIIQSSTKLSKLLHKIGANYADFQNQLRTHPKQGIERKQSNQEENRQQTLGVQDKEGNLKSTQKQLSQEEITKQSKQKYEVWFDKIVNKIESQKKKNEQKRIKDIQEKKESKPVFNLIVTPVAPKDPSLELPRKQESSTGLFGNSLLFANQNVEKKNPFAPVVDEKSKNETTPQTNGNEAPIGQSKVPQIVAQKVDEVKDKLQQQKKTLPEIQPSKPVQPQPPKNQVTVTEVKSTNPFSAKSCPNTNSIFNDIFGLSSTNPSAEPSAPQIAIKPSPIIPIMPVNITNPFANAGMNPAAPNPFFNQPMGGLFPNNNFQQPPQQPQMNQQYQQPIIPINNPFGGMMQNSFMNNRGENGMAPRYLQLFQKQQAQESLFEAGRMNMNYNTPQKGNFATPPKQKKKEARRAFG